MLQDILLSGFVERYGYIDGVGAAPASEPRLNLTGDPYYTDGFRAVIFLSDRMVPLGHIDRLPWNAPLAPREESGRGEPASADEQFHRDFGFNTAFVARN